METNKDITDKVEALLKGAGQSAEVPISPFFKDRTLDRMFANNDEVSIATGFSWFKPKMQWAALLIIFLANSFVLYTLNQSDYNLKLDRFAETYQLDNNAVEISSFLK